MLKIVELRKAAGITQCELAKRLGISQPSVTKWEKGRVQPTIANLNQMADIFGVTVDEILGRSRDASA